MASILCGQNAPVDYGDGAGMNLLNLKTLQWDKEIADFTAPGLINKLPQVAPTGTRAGGLSKYYNKYGLQAGIPVLTWSGDNPCSLIGTGAAEPGVAVISLGTSDTFFATMRNFKTDPDGYGHVFGNPASGFMSLICFTNGSLAREKIKSECNIDWNEFDHLAAIDSSQCGENLMLPYFDAESTPLILTPSVIYHGTPEFCSGKVSPEIKIRAILESQALTMKLHSGWMDEDFKRIRVTGGASNCGGFLQILANVFQADIERIAITDSAGLGAALIAAHNVTEIPYADLFAKFSASIETIKPDCGKAPYYEEALSKYAELEKDFHKHQS
jgi:xylulokinase